MNRKNTQKLIGRLSQCEHISIDNRPKSNNAFNKEKKP